MAEPLRFLAVCLRKEFKRQTFVPHIKWEMVVFERDYQAIQKKLLTTWSLVRIQLPEPFFCLPPEIPFSIPFGPAFFEGINHDSDDFAKLV